MLFKNVKLTKFISNENTCEIIGINKEILKNSNINTNGDKKSIKKKVFFFFMI